MPLEGPHDAADFREELSRQQTAPLDYCCLCISTPRWSEDDPEICPACRAELDLEERFGVGQPLRAGPVDPPRAWHGTTVTELDRLKAANFNARMLYMSTCRQDAESYATQRSEFRGVAGVVIEFDLRRVKTLAKSIHDCHLVGRDGRPATWMAITGPLAAAVIGIDTP